MTVPPQDVQRFEHAEFQFSLIDPDGSVAAETFADCGYEPGVRTILADLLVQSQLEGFLDIGAHHGYFTSFVSALKPDCRIYAFEPGHEQFEVLKRNQSLGLLSADLFNCALVDENASLGFKDRTLKVEASEANETVRGCKYDDLRKEHGIKAQLAKIDVHGAEAVVLSGMRQALQEELRCLLIEVHAQHLCDDRYSYQDIVDLLRGAGFVIQELLGFRESHEPTIRMLTGQALENFVDYSRWTDAQVARERMLLAVKVGL